MDLYGSYNDKTEYDLKQPKMCYFSGEKLGFSGFNPFDQKTNMST